jgi:uncharacterized membrane protein
MSTFAIHPITLGILAAICWGGSDFCGGVVTRRQKAITVMLLTDILTIILMSIFALLFGEQAPSAISLAWGVAAGTSGTVGLLLLFSGLAIGPMGVVSALSAVVAGGVPVLFALFTMGFPGWLAVLGFALATFAICLINFERSETAVSAKALAFALLSGLTFAILFLCLDQIEAGSAFWPLVASRVLILPGLVYFNGGLKGTGSCLKQNLALLLTIGTLDSLGNAAYTIATQMGRLDEASVIGSMYPLITVALSLVILKERLSLQQSIALACAVVAVVCIAL